MTPEWFTTARVSSPAAMAERITVPPSARTAPPFLIRASTAPGGW